MTYLLAHELPDSASGQHGVIVDTHDPRRRARGDRSSIGSGSWADEGTDRNHSSQPRRSTIAYTTAVIRECTSGLSCVPRLRPTLRSTSIRKSTRLRPGPSRWSGTFGSAAFPLASHPEHGR